MDCVHCNAFTINHYNTAIKVAGYPSVNDIHDLVFSEYLGNGVYNIIL